MKRVPFIKKEADQYIKERKQSPCFICEIVEGNPRRNLHHILSEDDQVIVFLSSLPTHYGQTLVCPKRHVEQVTKDLNEEEYLHLQRIIFKMSQAIQHAVHPERLYIASFGSQQMNKHVHFHILPLPEGVPIREQQMASMMPEVVGKLKLSDNEWKELAENIRRSI
jgi:histidine triad (HIT) family protein